MRPSIRARLARAAALPLLVLTLLLGQAAMASAAEVTTATAHEVLATEGHAEPPGLEPRLANDPDNEFKPTNYEPNFLWGAAIGLGAMVIGGFGFLGLLYWVMVVRPSQASANKSASNG